MRVKLKGMTKDNFHDKMVSRQRPYACLATVVDKSLMIDIGIKTGDVELTAIPINHWGDLLSGRLDGKTFAVIIDKDGVLVEMCEEYLMLSMDLEVYFKNFGNDIINLNGNGRMTDNDEQYYIVMPINMSSKYEHLEFIESNNHKIVNSNKHDSLLRIFNPIVSNEDNGLVVEATRLFIKDNLNWRVNKVYPMLRLSISELTILSLRVMLNLTVAGACLTEIDIVAISAQVDTICFNALNIWTSDIILENRITYNILNRIYGIECKQLKGECRYFNSHNIIRKAVENACQMKDNITELLIKTELKTIEDVYNIVYSAASASLFYKQPTLNKIN